MELTKFTVAKDVPGFVHLRHPITNELLTDEGKKVGVWLFGIDSPQFKKHLLMVQNKELESRRKGDSGIRAEDVNERLGIKACFHSFENISLNGETLDNPDQLDQFFDALPWTIDQLSSGIGSRENFMPALSKKS